MEPLQLYFKKIHHQLDASFNRALRSYGLTTVQFDLLEYLSRHPNSQNTLTDISTYFGVKHTSAIHVLKVLEKKGFIEKNKSPDARSKAITLTNQAWQVIETIRAQKPSVSKLIFAGLSDEELMLLEKMLHQIYTNVTSDKFQHFENIKIQDKEDTL